MKIRFVGQAFEPDAIRFDVRLESLTYDETRRVEVRVLRAVCVLRPLVRRESVRGSREPRVLKHARLSGKKDRRPFALVTAGGGGDGGPGSRVERDGERCYRGAPARREGKLLPAGAIGVCFLVRRH